MALANPGSDEQVYTTNRRGVSTATLRAATATTASYVATSHTEVGGSDKVTLLFDYVHDDATSIEYYVEWSNDGTNWYRSISTSTSGGTVTVSLNNATLAVSGSVEFADTFDAQAKFMAVRVKHTGGSGTNTLAVKAQHVVQR